MNLRFVFLLLASTVAQANDPSDSAAMYEAHKAIVRGDMSPIDRAGQTQNLFQLWNFFADAVHRQLRGRSTRGGPQDVPFLTAEQEEALQAAVKEKAGAYLKQIPGHAKRLGDKIEQFTQQNARGDDQGRESYLGLLSDLRSPEAIQQLARFLFDTRNPGLEKWYFGSGVPEPTSNERQAFVCLNLALGEHSPLYGIDPPQRRFTEAHHAIFLDWWCSEASLPFRQPLPGVELPAVVARPQDYRVLSPERKQALALESWYTPWPLWVNLTGGSVGVLLALWFIVHRRKKSRREGAELEPVAKN